MTVREVIEEETAQAGVTRQRVLTLLDRLHRDGAISYEQFAAGNMLRHALMRETPPSQGVSSYGNNIGHTDPTTKADRLGSKLTGFRIDYEGHVYRHGGRHWTSEQRLLEDALFAAVGVHDEAGAKRVNPVHAAILVQAVINSEAIPTLSGITKQLTDFYGSTKKTPAFALGVVSVWLSRLAQHFRLVK